jgi:hypothetical protein
VVATPYFDGRELHTVFSTNPRRIKMKKHLLIALTLALGGCVNKDLKPHDWAMDVQTA